ncbi:hypothetical protein SeMB42_g02235 [Synchytrium endobioticum]|uniref:Polyadenylation factor subunit 2 n=1 Tax=Synchytrium endobioticum TaxID=286115 RepID=A0A507DGB6_9FUNG|nr:hypothetical protein SeMB42_g02235 [Synchytrium endobioticum]
MADTERTSPLKKILSLGRRRSRTPSPAAAAAEEDEMRQVETDDRNRTFLSADDPPETAIPLNTYLMVGDGMAVTETPPSSSTLLPSTLSQMQLHREHSTNRERGRLFGSLRRKHRKHKKRSVSVDSNNVDTTLTRRNSSESTASLHDEHHEDADSSADDDSIASENDNNQFRSRFPDLTPDETLVDSFVCALAKQGMLPLQGRMYISQSHVCFYSVLTNRIAIDFVEIEAVERRSVVGVVKNSIEINAGSQKYFFTSFLSRDQAFDTIVKVWELTKRRLNTKAIPPTIILTSPAQIPATQVLTAAGETPPTGCPQGGSVPSVPTEQFDGDAGSNGNIGNSNTIPRLRKDGASVRDNGIKSLPRRSRAKSDSNGSAPKDTTDNYSNSWITHAHVTGGLLTPPRSRKPSYANIHKPAGIKTEPKYYQSCPCTLGGEKIYLDKEYNISLNDAWMLFAISCSQWREEGADSPLIDIERLPVGPTVFEVQTNWSQAMEYTMGLSGGIPFTPKSTVAKITSNIVSKGDTYICVLSSSQTPDVPMGSTFMIVGRCCITQTGSSKCRIREASEIRFTKSAVGMLKGTVESNAQTGLRAHAEDLDAYLTSWSMAHGVKSTSPATTKSAPSSPSLSPLPVDSNHLERYESHNIGKVHPNSPISNENISSSTTRLPTLFSLVERVSSSIINSKTLMAIMALLFLFFAVFMMFGMWIQLLGIAGMQGGPRGAGIPRDHSNNRTNDVVMSDLPPGYRRYGGATGQFNPNQPIEKRQRKSMQRRTIDYFNGMMRTMELRTWQRGRREYYALQPDPNHLVNLLSPPMYPHNPTTSVPTKYIHTSTNKVRCPINVVKWTPDGRRLVTGAQSGEFTLWNGLTFNFETILQAHDSAIRSMTWSHNDTWLVTADQQGIIKYWQSNMNNLKMFQGHREAIRDLAFSPTDQKFVSCSDDSTAKIWTFESATEERVLAGHGWDVKCCDWHPTKALIVTGSKDNLVKLWDPKTGKNLATLHGHKNTISSAKFNRNENWLLTGSRDHACRIFDIRNLKEVQMVRAHKKDVTCVQWHPFHETEFATGGADGCINFWVVGTDFHIGGLEYAHEAQGQPTQIWTLDWHPLGHVLVSGSNDHTTRFWTRNRVGEPMLDRFGYGYRAEGTWVPGVFGRVPGAPAPQIVLPGGVKVETEKSSQEEDEDEELPLPGLRNRPSNISNEFRLPGLGGGGGQRSSTLSSTGSGPASRRTNNSRSRTFGPGSSGRRRDDDDDDYTDEGRNKGAQPLPPHLQLQQAQMQIQQQFARFQQERQQQYH